MKLWNKYVEPKLDTREYNKIIDMLDDKYNKPIINIVETKVKGLETKLSIEELYFVLLNYCKHKGISYLDDEIYKMDDFESEQKLSYCKTVCHFPFPPFLF